MLITNQREQMHVSSVAKLFPLTCNLQGEVAISHHRADVKTYTSLHTLVNDMFPPTSLVEQVT